MVPPSDVQSNLSTIGLGLNDSQDSWSSLDLDVSVPPPPPPPPPPSARPSVKQLRGKIQARVQERVNDFWKEKIGRYVMQGDYISLIMEEKNCITWKSFIWDIPQGVLKFAMNPDLHTLPTFDNLKRWGKKGF